MTFFLEHALASLPALILGLLAAAAIAYSLTPKLRRGFRRRGIVDHPHERRVNTRPVPRGGGLAVVAAFVVVGVALTLFRDVVPGMPDALGLQPGQVVALFLGGILAALIGAIDDRLYSIDGSVVRAHVSAAGASKKNAPSANRPTMRSVVARAGSAPRST